MFELRPATRLEQLYCFKNSQQISMQTGLIGYLRGDMSHGEEYIKLFSRFFDFRDTLKTEEFKSEFDEVINALRFCESYPVLASLSKLAAYCTANPESAIPGDRMEYGFRLDTKMYTYLVRLNPQPNDYNFYIHCYVREWFERHMKNAEQGIRFITPHYKEKFRLADGDRVKIVPKTGEPTMNVVRYIDQTHVELGNNGYDSLYHICQLAEIMERNGAILIPYRASLPDSCFSVLPSSGELITVTKGDSGYRPVKTSSHDAAENRKRANDFNEKLKVSPAQEAAMVFGSMFGWDKPGADPARYRDDGTPLLPY